MAHSGIQKEVLALYRQCLRACRTKPARIGGKYQEARPAFKSFARAAFEQNVGISKREFGLIEYLLRKGKRQLEVYASPEVRKIDVR
ncbi:related to Found in Mitochondrial Proteome [Cephalotrichum gorgonifer]|uniref:Related to Found in Mitochondrial Proteome n=1 Tax=Cephalotrichum gorgonifer TaxID=2041049 RepID=A0AAE8MQ02_9PEZI|nr:related to Found in Mitochondrial Proteome [Cephalotrichum gorgonifer]